MSYEMQIAQTIREQIMAMDRMALMAWGSRNFQALPEGTRAGCTTDGDQARGGLHFDVSGAKFKGTLRVLLMPSDTYRIELLKRTYMKVGQKRMFSGYAVKQALDDVYAEDLARIIDRMVERGPDLEAA